MSFLMYFIGSFYITETEIVLLYEDRSPYLQNKESLRLGNGIYRMIDGHFNERRKRKFELFMNPSKNSELISNTREEKRTS